MKFRKKSLVHFLKKSFREGTQGIRKGAEAKEMPAEMSLSTPNKVHLPADSSDTSESDEDKKLSSKNRSPTTSLTCPVQHEGKKMLSEVFPIGIDDLFTLIFTYNKFNVELLASMKYTDVNISNWEENLGTGLKMRTINLVVPMTQPVGPKTCQVTEKQVMLGCSKPGELYVVEVEAVNAGVPYCDSFYVTTHLCLTRVSSSEASFTVHSQIKYRKSVWGLVKSFIEKNVWAGLEEFYKSLGKAIEEDCNRKQLESGVEVTRSQKRESFKVSTSAPEPEPVSTVIRPPTAPLPIASNDLALWAVLGVLTVLLLLNAVLYYKLSVMESFDKEARFSSMIDTQILSEERSHDQWVSLLQKQAIQHQKEVEQWKARLKSVVSLLKQAEELVISLQSNIQAAVSERVLAALEPLPGLDDSAQRNKHNEL